MGLKSTWKGLKNGIAESLGFKGHDKIGYTVGQWMNNITGSSAMLDQEYANNVALWNMQNQYNTPAAQMARMKAAGIDVNPMTYAVGNGSMSSTASNISAPSVGASGVNPFGTLLSVLSGIENVKAQKLANAMSKKDLEFYKEHHYRPGTSDWMTILPGVWKEYEPKLRKLAKKYLPSDIYSLFSGDTNEPKPSIKIYYKPGDAVNHRGQWKGN